MHLSGIVSLGLSLTPLDSSVLTSKPYFLCATIVHRNHFFRFYQQNKSSESKIKFRQASNRWKMVLEAAKLAYANKTKESITSQKTWLSGLLANCQ